MNLFQMKRSLVSWFTYICLLFFLILSDFSYIFLNLVDTFFAAGDAIVQAQEHQRHTPYTPFCSFLEVCYILFLCQLLLRKFKHLHTFFLSDITVNLDPFVAIHVQLRRLSSFSLLHISKHQIDHTDFKSMSSHTLSCLLLYSQHGQHALLIPSSSTTPPKQYIHDKWDSLDTLSHTSFFESSSQQALSFQRVQNKSNTIFWELPYNLL